MAAGNSLPLRNCVRRPIRTIGLIVLTVLLSFSLLAGSLVISGLRSGLSSLETRLGADIMVVPYEAATQSSLSNMVLQGNPGYFYMDLSVADELEGLDGIAEMSNQFYLATATASCCSYRVQVIGFDPETDFTITPWVQLSYKGDLGYGEVFVGHDLNAFPGDELTFYGTTVTVAARLEQTGTYLDTSVYANVETIQTLIQSAKDSKLYDFGGIDPQAVVSCVLINVADGYPVEEVLNDINLHVNNVKAVQTQSMISDVSSKLSSVSDIAGGLIAAVWVLVLIILILAVTIISNERKKEFAVLRILGASKGKLASILMKESLLVSVAGSFIGAALAVLLTLLFSGLIEQSLKLPFLLPGAGGMAILLLCGVAASILASTLTSAVCAYRISKVDPALVLRGRN